MEVNHTNYKVDIISDLSQKILSNLSVQDVVQSAVDNVVDKFNFLGGIILLTDKNKLYAKTISSNKRSRNFIKLLGGPITELKIDLKQNIANEIVQSILNKEVRTSNNLYDFTQGVLNKPVTKTAEIITGTKSSIAIPLIYGHKSIGALYFARDVKSDFKDILAELLLVSNLISVAIINARNYQELEEALRSEKDMMDIMAHELKTPLTVVKNSIELMDLKFTKNKPEDKKILTLVRLIKSNIDKEISLLENILASAKLENTEVEIEDVDLKEMLEMSYESFKSIAKEKNLEFTLKLGDLVKIKTDKVKLQQVIDNFISNAIKYTPEGYVEIGASKKGKFIEVYVKDSGEGISENDIKHIGKKFFRVDKEELKLERPSGTGIGLYVSFDIIRKLGGTYKIESEVGKGSTFSLKLKI